MKEEIKKQIKKLKKEKATEDRINNEAWLYMTQNIEETLIKVLEKVWEEEKIPEGWKKGVIYSSL